MKSWIESAFADEPAVGPLSKVRKTTTSRKKTTPQSVINSTVGTTKSASTKLPPLLSKIISNQPTSQEHHQQTNKKSTSRLPLTEKYEPKKRNDLVVHKSKIDQMNTLIDQISSKQTGSILIIEGPPGCGKNATLNVLCNEKGIDIMQWSQPNMTLAKIETNDPSYQVEFQQYESQAKLFDQFLFKSSRYISDQIFTKEVRSKKILYLKDLPYFAYRDVQVFQNQLRHFSKYSKYSLVISLTTSPAQSNELNPARVLTQDLRKELNILEITFNPLATSYMLKQIERIAQAENLAFTDANATNEICQSSDGDLRHAINILELATVKSSKLSVSSSASAKKRKLNAKASKENLNEPTSELIQKKDANFSIFRGLGKVLHRKNDSENEANLAVESNLPKHLMKYFRQPLHYSPEEIVSKLPISEELTTMYLHQNYLELYAIKSNCVDTEHQLDTLIRFSDSFIQADMINSKLSLLDQSTSVYNTKYKELPALISIRSVLFNFYLANEEKSNSSNNKSLWMPLHKPYNYKCNQLKRQRKQLAQRLLFKDGNAHQASYLIEMQNEFFTTILPFANVRNLYKELSSKYNSQVKQFKFRSAINNANENDPSNFMDDDLNDNDTLQQQQQLQKPLYSIDQNRFYEYDDNANIQIIDF